ncbi:MAG: host specificity factor TipJ family phage tail protein, partial [Pseudomonadota bacterium]|nr:host specificity factor TipJ family phage tail protein [Pseudomonadota bacterium]
MRSNIELIIVNKAMSYACDDTDCKILHGEDLFELVSSVYPNGSPLNTYWYQEVWDTEFDVTPATASDIIALNEQGGTFYVVTYPAGPETWIPILVSAFITVAAVLMMPIPVIPNTSSNAPPSPNNAVAQRTNRMRKGGRVAEIYGEVWSVPDLAAETYSVYIDNVAVEMSYMFVGVGQHLITQALDDKTPINQIFGSSVLVYNPDSTPDDAPAYQFGSAFTAEEAEWSRLDATRYTSVNGQTLQAPDSYLSVETIFKNPNIIETSSNADFRDNFAAGDTILIEGADNLASANELTYPVNENDPESPQEAFTYTLNGQYEILSVTEKQITLSNPAAINSDWQTLADNVDFTVSSTSITLSAEATTLYQGWFYTGLKTHESAYVNIVAPNGLSDGEPNGRWRSLRLFGIIESELVDINNNPISGTLETQRFSIQSPHSEDLTWEPRKRKLLISNITVDRSYEVSTTDSSDNKIRGTAAVTVPITNSHFGIGKRLRFRIARTSNVVTDSSGGIVDELKIKDFYGTSRLSTNGYPLGFTTLIAKTRATEGALALKERKLYILAQRLVRDWQNNDALIPSKRIDDIIYDIATNPVNSNLTIDDLDMPQIKAEVDAQIAYFGTELCAQFCGTFDNKDITTEEMIQTVAMAGFFTAYRINNKICLHFERPEDYPVATFNSHSITPDSFDFSESFGPINNYDGVEVMYTSPDDDERITLKYPVDATNPDTKNKELIGVRNKVQAHMHMMRRHWKNQL